MSDNFYQETIKQINKAQVELKIRLEQVSKLKIECVKMQLELLKLYRPQCLEILESLRDVSAPDESSVNDNGGDNVRR